MTFSVGLIGCGDVARRYATAMNGAVEGLRLQAAWDIVHKAGADFAKRFGVEVVDATEGMRAVRLIDRIYSSFKPDKVALRNYFLPLFEGSRV